MSTHTAEYMKSDRSHKKQTILDDPERVKKDRENERRIRRLQQVREESNHLARKIREEVNLEKQRQLRKLRIIKQKELNCWRQHVLVHKHQDYRTAIFHVGDAHRAAKDENDLKDLKKKDYVATVQYQQPKKRMHGGQSNKSHKNKRNENHIRNTCNKPKCTSICIPEQSPRKSKDSKTAKCIQQTSKQAVSCQGSNKSGDDETLMSSSSTSSCHLSSDESDTTDECNSNANKSLEKTPAVILDIDVESDESVTVTTKGAIEINDKFVDINRRFCRIVNKSSDTSNETSKVTSNEMELDKNSNRNTKEQQETQVKKKAKPRFTLISELLQKNAQENEQSSCKPSEFHRHSEVKESVLQEESKKSNPPISPSKNTKTPEAEKLSKTSLNGVRSINNSRKISKPAKKNITRISIPETVSRKLPFAKKKFKQTASVAPPNSETGEQTSISKGTKSIRSNATYDVQRTDETTQNSSISKVKFYDYNNKYTRSYDQTTKSVQVNIDDSTQLNAMDHACIENQLKQLRKQEIEKLSKIAEERGRKALEKEQIRRDCFELTEKLDALSRQHPQLVPNDANFVPSHRFLDLATAREKKMSEALNKMILRPAIITCSEDESTVRNNKLASSKLKTTSNALNVGGHHKSVVESISASSESCCSVLLDCVEEQSKQLHSDLKTTAANKEKAEKLKLLLDRIGKIRTNLLAEIESGNKESVGGSTKDDINTIRQERADILQNKQKSFKIRESELLQKEALIDKKIQEISEMKNVGPQKAEKPNTNNCYTMEHAKDKPLEIIIKVKSDGQVKTYIPQEKAAGQRKINSVMPKPSTITNVNEVPAKNTVPVAQNTYDSASTSYRSLPQELGTSGGNVIHAIKIAEDTEDVVQKARANSQQVINPVIAYYVQRLLGMTRPSIQDLSASSSEVPTPTPSVINTATNISTGTIVDESLINERQMSRVQNFIEDNRSFVCELEDTLRSNANKSLETSLRTFDQMWNQRLENIQKQQVTKTQKKSAENSARDKSNSDAMNATDAKTNIRSYRQNKENITTKERREVLIVDSSKVLISKEVKGKSNLQDNERRSAVNNLLKERVDGTSLPQKTNRPQEITEQKVSKPLPQAPTSATSTIASEKQMERYARLTENCTHRIAELTELIHKVREEKQRLLEVTLTSASEAGRNSTEYFELPANKKSNASPTLSEPTKSTEADSGEQASSTPEMLPSLDNEPMQKHRPIGISRDSGISDSRPMTSQGQAPEEEPHSVSSSTKRSTAMRRSERQSTTTTHYASPERIKETVAHDLSTIIEIETPAPSHLNSTAKGDGTGNAQTYKSIMKKRTPVPFPTFEQYARELNMDLSRIDSNQSLQLQKEFNTLVAAINERSDKAANYQEFPSITSYLHNVTATHFTIDSQDLDDPNSPQTIRELIQYLRIANLSIKTFPSKKEYMQKLLKNNECDLIDSASLENITDQDGQQRSANEADSTESFNVEAELKQRKLLKASFRRTNIADGSSAAHGKDSFLKGASPAETGIDKLSSTQYDAASAEIDRELRRFGMQWPATMIQRHKEAAALSSGSTGSAAPRVTRNISRQEKEITLCGSSNDSGEVGRPLNLREFLRKELLKHVSISSSSSSSEDSLKSNFLQSLIQSLTLSGTPQTNTGMGTGTALTLDRQKTSTPVVSSGSSPSQANSSSATTQLFSGESRISSVKYEEEH